MTPRGTRRSLSFIVLFHPTLTSLRAYVLTAPFLCRVFTHSRSLNSTISWSPSSMAETPSRNDLMPSPSFARRAVMILASSSSPTSASQVSTWIVPISSSVLCVFNTFLFFDQVSHPDTPFPGCSMVRSGGSTAHWARLEIPSGQTGLHLSSRRKGYPGCLPEQHIN